MCFGGTFTIAMTVAKGRGQMDKKEIVRTLFSSMPFVTYLLMIVMAGLHLRFPEPVYTVAGMGSEKQMPFWQCFSLVCSLNQKSDAAKQKI